MKFAIAVVILAVAISANASHLGLGLGWNGAFGGWGAAPSLSVGAPWGAWGGAWNGAIDGTWTSGHHGAAVIAAPIAAAHHSGSYVAANRGSVHVAPLAGHIQSVKSVNVDPAPGTTW